MTFFPKGDIWATLFHDIDPMAEKRIRVTEIPEEIPDGVTIEYDYEKVRQNYLRRGGIRPQSQEELVWRSLADFILEVAEDKDKMHSSDTTTSLLLRMPTSMHAAYKLVAAERATSMQRLILEALFSRLREITLNDHKARRKTVPSATALEDEDPT